MIQLFENKASCFGCGACQAVCPNHAITMEFDPDGFAYPSIDEALCTECGLCAATCPAKESVSGFEGESFAVRCKDLELLRASSSGGAFSLIAEQVLRTGGLVCGAAFDEDFRVKHILSDDISAMRKSKYVQSDLDGTYQQIAQALEQGKQVLFTGTPCQCDGVRRYFGEQPKGLVLAALICRGVQSPQFWKDYTAWLTQGGKLEAYCFRDKRICNDGHTVSYTIDGCEHAVSMGKDPLSRLYMKCLTLRPSCYQCPYTRWELPFDLTIGDFWGVEKTYPELADGMGVSLVIARTQAAQALMEAIKPYGLVQQISRQDAQQPALDSPAKQSMLCKLFTKDFSRKNADGACDIPLILKKYGG